MAIFRGIGGAGENNQDATITAVTQQAINAAISATQAANSATQASTSSSSASTSATNAAASEAAAATSETNAAASAAAALVSETASETSELAAATSATTADTKAAEAVVSADNAAASAASIVGAEAAAAASAVAAAASQTAAAASENNAAASASAASTSATAASTSATNAAASATAASASEAAAAASFDAFDDRYLGSKASDPSVDNDGNALLVGALYYDNSANIMKVFNGTAWVAAYATLSGALFGSNNLSDLDDVAVSRANLGLGSAATQDTSAFIAPNSTATLYSLTTTDGMEVGGSMVVTGNLTVNGTTTTIDTTNLAVEDNMIYLNSGSAVTNPDLGFAGNYNDGTYAHAGFFRDATNGRWKAFDGYTPEPDTSPEIDTSHASFNLAAIEASTFYGNLVGNADTATLAATATNVAYSGLTGTVPTWNQNTTGNAATADYATIAGTANAVPYANLTGTVPTWNQNTTGNAATADYATTSGNGGVTSVNGQTGAVTVAGLPAGAIANFAMSTAPSGWLKANGAAVSRTTYADLFAAIGTTYGSGDGSTTFNVPDLRGEFQRGWDDGRGVDSGRGFGSFQDHEFGSHNHTFRVYDYGSGGFQNVFGYPQAITNGGDRAARSSYNAEKSHLVQYTGGSETRPRNIALLTCIKT